MKMRTKVGILFMGVAALAAQEASADAVQGAAWRVVSRLETAETADLRGFGRCAVTCETMTDGARRVDAFRFATASATNAETVAGKFLHDVRKGAGVAERDGVLEAPGAAFAVARRGTEAVILAAPDAATLADWLGVHPDVRDGLVTQAACPEWMSPFAWGTYGMGGLEDFHNWMNRAGAKRGEQLDPREDFAFLKEMGGMHFDNWLELEGQDDSDGIVAANGVRWKAKYAEDQGIPYAYRLYMPCNGFDWIARRFADHMEQPAPWMMNGWLRYDHAHQPHLSWYDADIWCYIGRQTADVMRKFKTPAVRGWMHPAGEIVHQPWYDMHGDYSPAAKADWTAFLKRNGVTLSEASEMYSRGENGFVSWDQVEPPEFATFAGLPGLVKDLAGTWFSSSNRTDWTALAMPGNLDYLKYYDTAGNDRQSKTPRRMRRFFGWDPAVAAGRKVYLYFFPMSPVNVRHEVTLNGEKVADVGTWCALDVTDRLRTGANELEFLMRGHFWNGRVFLSTQEPAVYPNLGAARNRMYALWNDWRRDAKRRKLEIVFEAMRQADPDAPIKMMAPITLGTPITDELMRDWGGFAHFTGEGIWYFPWYKRYGRLWGYPGTSELAGPYATVEDARRSTLRVFLAGLDMHEPVFLTQTYSRNPSVRAWWLAHRGLLQRMGTYDIDIAGPQVLIYRRSLLTMDSFPAPEPLVGVKGHDVNTPWDWDIGRGALQSLGQSMLYIDDDGVAAGKMRGFRVMVDSGNEIHDPARLAEIADWVKAGGTFIAWPFTGRSLATANDAWPIAALAGAKAAKLRPLGGTVTWKGRAYPDTGRTVDSNGNNRNDYSVELAPTDAATEIAATYENGAAAITVRRLGKGRVVWLGSAFARDSRDVMGIWWPGAGETAFWKELLADVGADAAVCTTDDPLVWAQPYRSGDGLDAVTVLCNFNTNGMQKARVALRVPRRPAALTAWSARGEESLAFDFADGVCTFAADLAAQEAMVVNARVYEPADAVGHWWKESQSAWRELKKPTRDFSNYAQGKWKDPTQDLKAGWTFADSGKPCVADALQFWGLADGAAATITKTFDLGDPKWLQGGRVRFVCGAWVGPNFLSSAKITLNGVVLREKTTTDERVAEDVTSLLKPTGNVLAFAFDAPPKGRRFTGVNGAVYLFHRAFAEESFALAKLPTRQFVPKEWEGRCRVFVHMEPKPGARVTVPLGVETQNGRYMRRHHHRFGNVTDVDVTSILRFGEENVLKPCGDPPRGGWDFSKIDVRLELFPVDGIR